ncbi:thymidylate kinase isoform X2 [Scyliorhinus canicula]|uniref:thymidylate kinase isoform X2 n=1 Tax=Scyliorhinus canicula TaxID=7830 RepID=UPI0018F449B0|nr:thymidylate kinase isoform X2 [Scyliorhinus canicula]
MGARPIGAPSNGRSACRSTIKRALVSKCAGLMATKRGALIVLEGMDRSGKTTQCRRLQEALRQQGRAAEVLRFPDRGTEIGHLISSYLEKKKNLDDHTVHLLFAANRWERVPLIKEKLQEGVTVILDRYAFSGAAFTSAKPDFTLEWCKQPDIGIPKPDVILFLHLNPSIAMKRGGFGNERYEKLTFQELVLQQFEELMKDESLDWKRLDASQSIDDLHQEIMSKVKKTIEKASKEPIGELWK